MILQEATEDDLSDRYMVMAAEEASKSPQRFQLGAVLKIGKTKFKGHNKYQTHTKYGFGRWKYLHAESCVISKAINLGYDLSKATLYVYRRGGLLAKPCPDCEKLIRKMKIKKVIYS